MRAREAETGLTPVDLSHRNLAQFYRDELLLVLDGERVMEVFGDNIRRQLRAYGLIKREAYGWRPAELRLQLAGVDAEPIEVSFGKRPLTTCRARNIRASAREGNNTYLKHSERRFTPKCEVCAPIAPGPIK